MGTISLKYTEEREKREKEIKVWARPLR